MLLKSWQGALKNCLSNRPRVGSERKLRVSRRASIPTVEQLEPRELLVAPTVSLGNVVSLTEGFGYDSTIEGLA